MKMVGLKVQNGPSTNHKIMTCLNEKCAPVYIRKKASGRVAYFLRSVWEENDPRLREPRGSLAPCRAFKSHVNRVCKSTKLFIASLAAGPNYTATFSSDWVSLLVVFKQPILSCLPTLELFITIELLSFMCVWIAIQSRCLLFMD